MENGKITDSWVFRIIFVTVAVYVFQLLTAKNTVSDPLLISINSGFQNIPKMIYYGALRPVLVIEKLYIWQFVSYMFLHDTGGFFHIFFNMYALLICGIPIEQLWGKKRFLFYYFFTGIGAGLCIFIMNYYTGNPFIATLGASGAVFGVLLAFGVLFPDVEFLVFFILPMKAKYFVILYGVIELVLTVKGGSNISHIGHVGGLLFGIIYFLVLRWRGIKFKSQMFMALIKKELEVSEDNEAVEADDDNREFLRSFYQKVRHGGVSSVTDDEFQKYKYIEIMNDATEGMCVEEDFEDADAHCMKCDHYEQCMIREIKKYL